MKKVAHYKKGAYLPFTEQWIYGQIKNLKGFAPVVYCHGTQNLDSFGIENIRSLDGKRNKITVLANTFCGNLFHYFPYFGGWLKKDRPDIIHSHFGPSGYFILRLKNYFSVPMVTTFYGYDLSKLPVLRPRWKKRYKKLFRDGEIFLTEGTNMKKCLVALGCPEKKVIVHHIGVDLERIKFMPRKVSAGGEIRVFVCGRFREKKGIPYAVEAFGLAKKNNPGLNIKLTILGASSGCRLEELEKQKIFDKIKQYGLEKEIVLLGKKPYAFFLEEIYRHHIFLSPSVVSADGDTEGGVPVSMIEASASGMPVLATTHCDIPEVVKSGETGFLVGERDALALAEKLTFLAKNNVLWEKLGAAARAHIEREYDIKKQAVKLELIYNEAIKSFTH